jgi:hypothetical protein
MIDRDALLELLFIEVEEEDMEPLMVYAANKDLGCG